MYERVIFSSVHLLTDIILMRNWNNRRHGKVNYGGCDGKTDRLWGGPF